VAAVLVVGLGVIGSGVEARLQPTSLGIPGTPSAAANLALQRNFGASAPFAILLRGPAEALDRQGPALVRALRRTGDLSTLSPWDRGSLAGLRPGPRRTLILANYHVGLSEAVKAVVPKLEAILRARVHPPVRAIQSGYASIARALQEESINASEHGELIALPILLIVLLVVFRSPVAAAIPLGFGAITVLASRGVLYLLSFWLGIDAFALTVCTMMGLALGVDYTLLMVSRFREELAGGGSPPAAALATRRTAGRTTLFAGATLLLSMLVALLIVPGSLLASLAGTVAMVVAISVVISTVLVPALLALLGPNLELWRIGPAPKERSRLMAVVEAALRRPAPVATLIGGVVLLLAAPALALRTGSPGPQQLGHSASARRNIETIDRVIGPGWDAPFQIIATTRNGPITEPATLAALSHWQQRIAHLPGVTAVVGPAAVAKKVRPLQELGDSLLASEGRRGQFGSLSRLGRKLAVAAAGVGQLRQGLSQASGGAGLLAAGSTRTGAGAHALSQGLASARLGSQGAARALRGFAAGTRQLAGAQNRAAFAGLQLKEGSANLTTNLRHNALGRSRRLQSSLDEEANLQLPALFAPAEAAEAQLKEALGHLEAMSVGRSDAEFQPTLEAIGRATAALGGTNPLNGDPYGSGYSGLPSELRSLQSRLHADAGEAEQVTSWLVTAIDDLRTLTTAEAHLEKGLAAIKNGGVQLAHGSAGLARAAARLQNGLSQLLQGAKALTGGISRLGSGIDALRVNLGRGSSGAGRLGRGLSQASVQVIGSGAALTRQLHGIRSASPHLFDSGDFVLAVLNGAPQSQREAVSNAVNVGGSGQGASILVISKYGFDSPGSIALNRRLDSVAVRLGHDAHLSTGVAGGTAELNEYGQVTRARLPYVIAAIAVATFLVLVGVLRAVPLAAIAVGLNLATVGVAFGVLTLLFNVPADLPLGGHTYIDAVGATVIFGIVFGLSIDYAVFLLARMRESRNRGAANAAAIKFGLERTARVITGAAAIMMAVFIAFAGAPVATVSQLGAGLTVAVLLDATVVRIILLPALMLLIGDRVWWLPGPLERALPRLGA
jgi:putative drug exporter of the RND superfamily